MSKNIRNLLSISKHESNTCWGLIVYQHDGTNLPLFFYSIELWHLGVTDNASIYCSSLNALPRR